MSILQPSTSVEWVVTIFMGVVFYSIACTLVTILLSCSYDILKAVQSKREYHAQHKKVCPNVPHQGAHGLGINQVINNPAFLHPVTLGSNGHNGGSGDEDASDRFDAPLPPIMYPAATGPLNV